MIPKIIHYCWFGGNPKPKLAEKCIRSWKKHCPEYELIEWNENNFDIASAPLYVRQAYEAGKWAFVTDYVRLWAVYNNGGIYLDTDVELIRPLDDLLKYKAFFGFESNEFVATGLGFGAEREMPLLAEMMEDYYSDPFVLEDGSFDTTACPVRNTAVLLRHGLARDNSFQILPDGTAILPSEYLSPISVLNGEKHITDNTVSIHWFSGSWFSPEEKRKRKRNYNEHRREKIKWWIRIKGGAFLRGVFGNDLYDAMKKNRSD